MPALMEDVRRAIDADGSALSGRGPDPAFGWDRGARSAGDNADGKSTK